MMWRLRRRARSPSKRLGFQLYVFQTKATPRMMGFLLVSNSQNAKSVPSEEKHTWGGRGFWVSLNEFRLKYLGEHLKIVSALPGVPNWIFGCVSNIFTPLCGSCGVKVCELILIVSLGSSRCDATPVVPFFWVRCPENASRQGPFSPMALGH